MSLEVMGRLGSNSAVQKDTKKQMINSNGITDTSIADVLATTSKA